MKPLGGLAFAAALGFPLAGLAAVSKQPRFVFGGTVRVAADAAWTQANEPAIDDGPRLERLTLNTALGTHWRIRADYDFSPGAEGWRSTWIQYRFRPGFLVRVGNQNAGFGLEESTPDGLSPFMELATSNALAPGRLTGALVEAWNNKYTFRGGFFGDRFLENLGDRRGTQGNGAVARFIVRPLATMQNGVAFGGTVEYRNITDDDSFRLRARSESDLVELVDGMDTGQINGANYLTTAGLEGAWAIGPVILAAEALSLTVDRRNGPSMHPFAWNTWATWIMTGERRNYRMSSASFVEIPVQWPGAVELAVRATGADFDNDAIDGGRQFNTTAAVNWYPHTGIKLMLEYGHNETRRASLATTTDGFLQVRVQFEYEFGNT